MGDVMFFVGFCVGLATGTFGWLWWQAWTMVRRERLRDRRPAQQFHRPDDPASISELIERTDR